MAKRRIASMLKNQNGVGFIELLIGSAMLGVSVLVYMGINNFLVKKNKDTQETVVVSNYVNGLYNSIQSNLEMYQITYDSKSFINATSPSDLNTILPLVWNADVVTEKEQCPKCPGRMGYIIEPVNGYRSLYKLTIRVTHPKITGYKDYVMLLVGK